MSNQVSITCVVDKEDANAFRSVANLFSSIKTNVTLAGQIFAMGLEKYVDNLSEENRDKLDPRTKLMIMAMEARARERDQDALNSVVCSGLLDESLADQLHEIATELDLDESQAEKLAKHSPFASVVTYSNNGTKMGNCVRWLATLLSDDDNEIARETVITSGKLNGFHESMINRASRKLRVEKHKKDGGLWYWKAPGNNNNNNNNNS